MKQIYVIALFFVPFWTFSQLYVKPFENKDSYVYVEGGLLFVEKEIDLKLNPGEATTASIYLRNEGQLSQGNQNSVNSGNGFLSVFQEGKATAYTYNYWSSPVVSTSQNTQFGNIFYDPVTKTQSNNAAITNELNGSSNPLKISNRWIYKLSGSDYSDWMYVGDNFNVAPGEGFTMKGVDGTNTAVNIYGTFNNPGNEQRYDFRGKPNNGLISPSVSKGETKLIGNPYPSSLDLNAFLVSNTNTTGIAYFWDSNPVSSHYLSDYEGGYAAYSPALGNNGYVPAVFMKYDHNGNTIDESGNSGNYYARRYSPIAQGFVVEGLRNGSISFNNSLRVFEKENAQTSQFKSSAVTNDISVIRLSVDFGNKYIRQLLLAFHPEATKGVDRAMDAKNLIPLKSDASWGLENGEYLINIRPLDKSEEIALAVNTSEETEITFTITTVENFEDDIYLLDTATGEYHNLINAKVPVTLNGSFPERFKITLTGKNDNSVPVDVEESASQYAIFQNNKLNILEVKSPEAAFPEYLDIYDITGKKVVELRGNHNQSYYQLSTANLSRGTYIIKIKSTDGTIISKKVIISN